MRRQLLPALRVLAALTVSESCRLRGGRSDVNHPAPPHPIRFGRVI